MGRLVQTNEGPYEYFVDGGIAYRINTITNALEVLTGGTWGPPAATDSGLEKFSTAVAADWMLVSSTTVTTEYLFRATMANGHLIGMSGGTAENTIYFSPNGLNWASAVVTTTVNNQLVDVVWDGAVYIALVANYYNNRMDIYTSPDLVTWTFKITLKWGLANRSTRLASDGQGNAIAVGSIQGGNVATTSNAFANSVQYTEGAGGVDYEWDTSYACEYLNGAYYSTSGSNRPVVTSVTGAAGTWTKAVNQTDGFDYALAANSNTIMAFGSGNAGSSTDDGASFSSFASGISGSGDNSSTMFAANEKFYAASTTQMFVSEGGAFFTGGALPPGSSPALIGHMDGRFIAKSSNGIYVL